MKRNIVGVLAASALVLGATGANAGPLEDGTAAFERGEYVLAEKLIQPLAEQGDPSAEGVLGMIYVMGVLPNHEPKVGVEWLRKAAAGDDPLAEYILGKAYLEADFGFDPDAVSAAMWLQRAAGHTDPFKSGDAQLLLAQLYESGAGVAQSDEEARKWFEKAAVSFQAMSARGLTRAKLTLGSMYASGVGLQKDEAKATSLYREVALEYTRAAEQGSASMQSKLAGLYRQGIGVPRDAALSFTWLRRAADQGNEAAMVELAGFYMRLSLPNEFGGPRGYFTGMCH